MKSTEIRIGNFVDVINRSGYVHLPFNVIRKVGYIELFKVKLYEHDKPFAIQGTNWEVDIADLSPIPLTEDWLKKFGFKLQENGIWYVLEYCGEYTKGSLSVNSIGGNIQIGGDVATQAMKGCKYVHQLQNLHFALFAEELEILGTDARA